MTTFEEAVIHELHCGSITRHDLPKNGICELGIRVGGRNVLVTWYSGLLFGGARSIEIDGVSYPASGGAITSAAKARAKGLAAEIMASLDASVRSPSP